MDLETFWKGLGAEIATSPIEKIPGGILALWTVQGNYIGFVRILPNGEHDCYLFDPYDAERVPLEVLWKGLEKKMAERAARGNYEPRMKEAEAVVILRYNPLYGYQVCTGNFNLITDYIYSLDPRACIISAIERLIEEAEK